MNRAQFVNRHPKQEYPHSYFLSTNSMSVKSEGLTGYRTVSMWCQNNLIGKWDMNSPSPLIRIFIAREEDAMMFRLRWDIIV